MRPDDLSFEAKKDLLIANFADEYYRKHKKRHYTSGCMRDLARLLMRCRVSLGNRRLALRDLLVTRRFKEVLETAKRFPSKCSALELGSTLKNVCDVLVQLVMNCKPGFRSESPADWLTDIYHFRKMIQSHWLGEFNEDGAPIEAPIRKRKYVKITSRL